MPIPTVITDLSATAASNYPAGTDAPSTLDDVQRAHAAFIRQTYDSITGANSTITSMTALTSPFLDISATVTLTSTSYGKTNRFTAAAAATLPALSGVTAGTVLNFVSNTADGTANSVIRNGSDTILFAGTAINTVPMRSKGDSMTLIADPANTQWIVAAENIKTSFSVYKSAAGQNVSNVTVTTVVYDAETKDTTNSFASNVWTCPFSGNYTFATSNYYEGAIDATQARVGIRVNGTTDKDDYVGLSGTSGQSVRTSINIDCVAGDTVEVIVSHSMGVTATLTNSINATWFTGVRNR